MPAPGRVRGFWLKPYALENRTSVSCRKMDSGRIQRYWEESPAGTYGLEVTEGDDIFFEVTEKERDHYLGSLIYPFAAFTSCSGRHVLEVGLGLGVDHLKFHRAGARVVGIDLTSRATRITSRRIRRSQVTPMVAQADVRELPFPDNAFDLVYSWGVIHHVPSPSDALSEIRRVLVPGGTIKLMLYHLRSWVAALLWLRYGLFRWRGVRDVLASHLESPGTRAYTVAEARALLKDYEEVQVMKRLTPYDSLSFKSPEQRHGRIGRLAWIFFPRRLPRWLGDRFGFNLLITARRPMS